MKNRDAPFAVANLPGRDVMRILILFGFGMAIALQPPAVAGETDELARIKNDYADVLALSGTARDEILAFARVLQARVRERTR